MIIAKDNEQNLRSYYLGNNNIKRSSYKTHFETVTAPFFNCYLKHYCGYCQLNSIVKFSEPGIRIISSSLKIVLSSEGYLTKAES